MATCPRTLRGLRCSSTASHLTPCRTRSSLAPGPSWRVDSVSSNRCCQASQSRLYATPSIKSPKAKVAARKPKATSWADIEKPARLSDVTPSVLESVIKATGFRHQPHQYIECAEKYESVADRGDQRWPFLLDEEDRPSPQLMHETACLMSSLKTAAPTGMTAFALWVGASELGHIPSTLTIRLTLRYRYGASEVSHPFLKSSLSRFRALVTAGNPSALAIEGMLYADKNDPAAAIRTIERALSLDRDGSVWRTGCHGVLGEMYVKVGRTEEGVKHLRMAVNEQHMPQYGEPLSKLVQDKDEAWALLYKAACVKPSLFAHLADAEVQRAESLSDKSGRDEAYKMASEWSRLADPNVSC